ncbi:hypothetical protein FVE85_3617 [Porphyridium purpureum]|uniref:Uncharacterized protein n=1 Tax=Porphyridium purpureum TaxID=35688 RepID=A0A5J4YL17_PORPP|nr:hypothetical protein FVE85_3617 [Porphyridium purpureum]|eukprot:POR7450..scf249_10
MDWASEFGRAVDEDGKSSSSSDTDTELTTGGSSTRLNSRRDEDTDGFHGEQTDGQLAGKNVETIGDDTSHVADGDGDVDTNTLAAGPFYAIRYGRNSFRGVVKDVNVFLELIRGERKTRVKAGLQPSLERAMEFCLMGRPDAPLGSSFFAFRYGKKGARGITITERMFKTILPRIEAPSLEVFRFNNTMQPLVFCEQAGTSQTDWKSLRASILFLAKPEPKVPIPKLLYKYVIKKETTQLQKGPPNPAGPKPADTEHQPTTTEDTATSATSANIGLEDESFVEAVNALVGDVRQFAQRLDAEALDHVLEIVGKLRGTVGDFTAVAEQALEKRLQLADANVRAPIPVHEESPLDRGSVDSDKLVHVESPKPLLVSSAKHIDAYIEGSYVEYPDAEHNAVAKLRVAYHFGDMSSSIQYHVGEKAFRLFQSSDDVQTTEDLVELEALVQALNYFIVRFFDTPEEHAMKSMTLKSRSMYCISRCNEFIPRWRQDRWRLTAAMQHMALWSAFDARLMFVEAFSTVKFELWVDGEPETDIKSSSGRAAGPRVGPASLHASSGGQGMEHEMKVSLEDDNSSLRRAWSVGQPGHIDKVLVDTRFDEHGRLMVRVFFGDGDPRNVCATCSLLLSEAWNKRKASMFALACGLDQILRHTLVSSHSAFAKQSDVVVCAKGLKAEDVESHLRELSTSFPALRVALSLRLRLLKKLRGIEVLEFTDQESEITISNVQNERVVSTILSQLRSSKRLELDRKILVAM